MKKVFSSFVEIIEVALVAVGTVFLIRNFLFQPFLVSGASMIPNFTDGDYLLVDELTYHVRAPERGEVIVFKYPKDESIYFIKRIIGLPGERIIVQDGALTIFDKEHPDGRPLGEGYLPKGTVTSGSTDVTLKQNEYFVMGDNRPFSLDSRTWGVLQRSDIVGIARLRLWPLAHIEAFAAPKY